MKVIGHKINEDGRQLNSKGIEAITTMPPPPIPRALDDFLDFVIIFAIVYQACQLKPKLSVLYLRNIYA